MLVTLIFRLFVSHYKNLLNNLFEYNFSLHLCSSYKLCMGPSAVSIFLIALAEQHILPANKVYIKKHGMSAKTTVIGFNSTCYAFMPCVSKYM